MALQDRKNTNGQPIGLNPKKDEKTNPFILTQRQHLIQRLNDILYKTQRNVITDEQVSDILKKLSHI